jgi:hypothetical protein
MSKRSDKFFNDRFDHLFQLPESILLDLARNEACPLEYRLTAVEIMRSKGFSKVNHPDLAQLLAHIEEEEDQFGASKKAHFGSKNTIPESKTDPISPILVEKAKESSPPSASVTTTTMFARPEIEFEREDDGRWIAEAVETPGAMAYGNTKEEAESKVEAILLEQIPENGQ